MDGGPRFEVREPTHRSWMLRNIVFVNRFIDMNAHFWATGRFITPMNGLETVF
jgi:hypothetical protein